MNWWESIVLAAVVGILHRIAQNPKAAQVELETLTVIKTAADAAVTAMQAS